MGKLRALWELTRLEHGAMIAMAIFIGAVITGKTVPPLETSVFAFLTALLLEAATFSLNDYFDFEVDTQNQRYDRPLVRGDLRPRTAILVYLLLLPAGIITSYLVNTTCFIIALVNATIATLYDIKFKEIKIISNFYIAFVMAIPFIFGATAISPNIPLITYVIAFIAFLTGVAREIMKDVMDFEGDKTRETRSFPLYIGRLGANRLAALFYITAIILSFLPFLSPLDSAYYHDLLYLSIILITNILLLYTSFLIVTRVDHAGMKISRKISLLAIFIGLIAFLVGAFA